MWFSSSQNPASSNTGFLSLKTTKGPSGFQSSWFGTILLWAHLPIKSSSCEEMCVIVPMSWVCLWMMKHSSKNSCDHRYGIGNIRSSNLRSDPSWGKPTLNLQRKTKFWNSGMLKFKKSKILESALYIMP